MKETKIFENNKVAQPSKATEQIKIKGILTSNIRTRTSTDVPYMAFFRANDDCEKVYRHSLTECEAQKCKECEIPVIFRITVITHLDHLPEDAFCIYKYRSLGEKHWAKPNLKKGDSVILEGEFSRSKDSNRPSFTCYSYQLISHGNN